MTNIPLFQYAWVMPNSSARCAQLPRAVDKVPFYVALKKFRDHLRGDLPDLKESEVTFPEVKLQNFNNKRIKDEDAESGDVMDGEESRIDPDTGKKRRGRPPKPRPDGSMPPPKKKRVDEYGNPLPKGSNPIDPVTGKKKRGRPKKSDMPPIVSNGFSSNFVAKEEDSDTPSSKTPTKLPPFSPNFARVPVKDSESDKSVRSPTLSLAGGEAGDSEGAKSLTREPSGLSDLSVSRVVGEPTPTSPPSSPPQFETPRSLHEDETSHSTEDRRPDSARSLTRPQLPCGGTFSNPTTPVDGSGHSVQNYQNQQQRFSPFQRGPPGPHQSPNYHPGANSFHAPYRQQPGPGTPPHRNFDSPQPRQANKPHDASDVSTKSLTGLESLVDQIPAIAENDSGVFSGSGGGSHPPTPRSVGPYSPGQYHGTGQAQPYPHYNTGQYQPPPGGQTPNSDTNSYQGPTDLSTSTNYGSVTTASHSPSTPSNFSVSSLAHSSVRHSETEAGEPIISSHPFLAAESSLAVSSLASDMELPTKYPPGIPTNPYMSGIQNHSSMFGAAAAGSLMSRSIGPPNSFMSGGVGSMAAAGMAGMAGMAGRPGNSNGNSLGRGVLCFSTGGLPSICMGMTISFVSVL